MDLGLKDKVAVVMGGSRGIGKAIVEALLAEGCRVCCCARSGVEHSNWQGGEIAAERLRFACIDIRDQTALETWIRSEAQACAGIDILIGNASALATGKSRESWQANLEVDVLALQTAIEAALPWLENAAATGGDAAVLGISSVSASLTSFPGAYGAIKAAQVHYVKGLAHQLASKHIRANTLSPGTIYFSDGTWGEIEREQPEEFAAALARNPTGRMGSPEEIANVAALLVSPRASFVLGANIVVDGALSTQLML
jgi:3-oxoacyl-[acyl-carrier protein] reductase